jgi:hypothetical protein
MTCCKIDGCDREATYKAAQMCKRHYLRHWRGDRPLSLREQVAAVVLEHGRRDFDQINAEFPSLGRKTVRRAVHNACDRGLIVLESRGLGNHHMSIAPAVYRAPRADEGKAKPPTKAERTRVASVFDLATPGVQHLPAIPGRKYSPLGDWNAP